MAIVFMTSRATSQAAIFEEAPGGGDADDPNSLCNRPLLHPVEWLANIFFHTDLDYYQVALGPTDVEIEHPVVPGKTTNMGSVVSVTHIGQRIPLDHPLVEHNLGYVPRYMIVWNGSVLPPATIIQLEDSNRKRVVTPYATETHIHLYESGFSSNVTLPAVTETYSVIVFKAPVAGGENLFDFERATGRVVLGGGKFDSDLLRLRQASDSAASPFDIPLGPTVDIANGAVRTVLPDGTTYEESNYNGSFMGSPSIECEVT